MDDAKIVALLSSIEPSEGEIPKPPFMAAIPAGPVLSSGADPETIDAWVSARGGWTHRTPPHLAGPDGKREPLFYIVPRGHLEARPGGAPAYVPSPKKASLGVAGGTPARGLAAAPLTAFAATNDLPAARAFYERGLGLPLTGESPIACTFDAGGTTLRDRRGREAGDRALHRARLDGRRTSARRSATSPGAGSTSSASTASSRTSWGCGALPAARSSRGSRIPTPTRSR